MGHRHKMVGAKQQSKKVSKKTPSSPLPSKIAESRNYVKQLEYEIERLESMQPNAFAAVRFHRCFGAYFPWPILYVNENTIRDIIENLVPEPLNDKEKRRLRQILE